MQVSADENTKFEANTESLSNYTVPEWYRDAKFGIFIHYGVYSVPAYGDEWYGHWMYMNGTRSYGGSDIFTYHLNTFGSATEFGYKDFIPEFNKEIKKFSSSNKAEEWAQLFSDAGAQYVMPVGIHHDSFALYNSDIQTTYNSVTQASVDYIKELQDAVKNKGMYFGISNHFAENDWFFDDSVTTGTDIKDETYAELYGDGKIKSEDHIRKWYDISMEIIEKYQPDLIYYDFDLVDNAFNRYDDANRYLMLSNYYNLANEWGKEGVICNYKNGAFTQSEAVLEKEREALGTINPAVWQTCTSIGKKSWGYTSDEVYRNGTEFITALIDIVSKNGNLLLNVGPESDGTIPEKAKTALLEVGNWLGLYGDAIYATRPWLVYGEGPTSNSGDNYAYSSKDIRFTKSKDNKILYATAMAKPDSDILTITTLKEGDFAADKIGTVKLINGSDRTELNWEQDTDGLKIKLPDYESIDTAYAVEISFKEEEEIPPVPVSATEDIKTYNYYEADGIDTVHCTSDGGEMVVNTKDDAYIKQLIDLQGKELSALNLTISPDSEGTIELRNGSRDGNLIGSATVEKAEGTDYRQIFINADLEGSQDILDLCIVFTGNIKMNRYKFTVQKGLGVQIEAEDYDGLSGTVQAEPCGDAGGGENLGYVGSGDWALYSSVDFGKSCNKLTMRLAGFGQSLQVRLDSPTGEIIATASAVNTGNWQVYKTFEFPIEDVSGIHDLYITFQGPVNVNWFLLEGEEETEEPAASDTGDASIDEKTENNNIRTVQIIILAVVLIAIIVTIIYVYKSKKKMSTKKEGEDNDV